MAAARALAVTTRVADLAGATLTRLPAPGPATVDGTAAASSAAATVKAASLWSPRPAVVLVLRRPG